MSLMVHAGDPMQCFFFLLLCLSLCPFTSEPHCFLSPGDRAAEGGDGEVGESSVLGGHADCIRRPLLTVLVQPFFRLELQEEPWAPRRHPPGRDHRGGCHRDTTQLAPPAGESINCRLAGFLDKHKDIFETGLSKCWKTAQNLFLIMYAFLYVQDFFLDIFYSFCSYLQCSHLIGVQSTHYQTLVS